VPSIVYYGHMLLKLFLRHRPVIGCLPLII
jgi:hypothetical protein